MSSNWEAIRFTRKWLDALHTRLLNWFSRNARSFPWRETGDPFLILVAEKLLQQTAARPSVVQAYETIAALYPTPEKLARADLEAIHSVVAPLGLPARSGEMISCARVIYEKYAGQVPEDLDELRSLPGVGEYISRAVLCFGFSQPIAVVDTNVARWLFRLHNVKEKLPPNPARHHKLTELAQSHLPVENPQTWNWAILDLCAAVCVARTPICQECPLVRICEYGKRAITW